MESLSYAYLICILSISWLMIDDEDLKNIWLMKKIWKGFNQQDVTRRPRGKVELWLCNGVQKLVKIVITNWFVNILTATLGKNK